MTRLRSTCFIALAVLVTLLLSLSPVSAHGYLLRSIPEDRAVLERAPARLQYWLKLPVQGLSVQTYK